MAVLLLASLLCGTACAANSVLTVGVYDATAGNAQIEGALVSLPEIQNTNHTNVNGEADFIVEYQNTYSVIVSKDGYISQTQFVNIKSPSKEFASVYLQREDPITIKITDVEGSDIAGAEVSVDGRPVGSSNSAGLVHTSMKRDAHHTISVSAPSYETYSENMFIEAAQSAISVKLKKSKLTPIFYVYDENKNPVADAKVYLDNTLVSVSDEYGRAQSVSSYTTGTYTVDAVKEGYANYQASIVLSENTSDIRITLSYSSVDLAVNVTADNRPVSGAVVYFNGERKGVTDAAGKFVSKEIPGTEITIKVSYEGYDPVIINHTVYAGKDVDEVSLALDRSYETVVVNVVAGNNPVSGASVYFNGVMRGTTDSAGRYSSAEVCGASFTIKASKEGYGESSVNLTVLSGGGNTVTVTLTQDVPVLLIGGIALAAVIVLAAIIVLVVRFGRKSSKSKNNRPVRRDSL